jgi:hypothetical protein
VGCSVFVAVTDRRKQLRQNCCQRVHLRNAAGVLTRCIRTRLQKAGLAG